MLHSLVFPVRWTEPAQDARTDTNALFTTCTHPIDNIDEAPLHYRRTIPSTRVTQSSANWVELCVRWFCFLLCCLAVTVVLSPKSSVVTASSVTPGCASVFESVQRFGEDSAVICLSVVCSLSSMAPGRASVFELPHCVGEDSAARFLSVIRFFFLVFG